MTAQEIYELLDRAGVEFDIVEIFDGVRIVRLTVQENEDGD